MRVTINQIIDAGAGVTRMWFFQKLQPCGSVVDGFYANAYDTDQIKEVIKARMDYQKRNYNLAKKHLDTFLINCQRVLGAIEKLEENP
jgi:hypothetical protein